MAPFDIRVFNPFVKPHQNKSLQSLFALEEKEKKRSYNQRVIQIEHGSFTPVVLSAYGGTGSETHHFVKTLVEKLAKKVESNKALQQTTSEPKCIFLKREH